MSINIASHLWEFNKHCNYHNFDAFLSERFTHRQKKWGCDVTPSEDYERFR